MESLGRVLWLMPLAFVIHDGEELLTMPAWLAAHAADLERVGAASPLARRLIGSLATTTPSVAVAIGSVLAIVLAVTVGASRSVGRGFWWHAYLAVTGVLFLHVFTHVLHAVVTGGYVPGLYGAVLAVLPGTAYVYARLFRAHVVSPGTAARDAAVGAALAIPIVLALHGLGRLVAG